MKHFVIEKQPDDTTCGPTCLHAVYSFYNDRISLQKVIEEVPSLHTGGTLAVYLACHALRRGYDVQLYVYNLNLFDPTWFTDPGCDIRKKLEDQIAFKDSKKMAVATAAYREFLSLGGRLLYRDLTADLISSILDSGTPILTGLSATYLYDCARERELTHHKIIYDDVRGTPTGHFVIICDRDEKTGLAHIADPYHDNPFFKNSKYTVDIRRLVNAILIGIITFDGNLCVIKPKRKSR